MPILDHVYVAAVQDQIIYSTPRWANVRKFKGVRYDVFVKRDPAKAWSDQVYTLDEWKASLCLNARGKNLPLNLTTKDGRWGSEIVSVELAQEEVRA